MTPWLLMAALAAPACAQEANAPAASERACLPPAANWRTVATETDRRRLRRWRDAWTEALDGARAAGHADEIARESVLLDPDAALPNPAPPPGDYRCRTLKLGAAHTGLLAFVSYPAFQCRIEAVDGRLTLAKLTGSQRPIGRLYPDHELRTVFLGTLQLGDERRAYQYGIDAERDMSGVVERIGPNRWRLVLPYPAHESLLDVIELTPRRR